MPDSLLFVAVYAWFPGFCGWLCMLPWFLWPVMPGSMSGLPGFGPWGREIYIGFQGKWIFYTAHPIPINGHSQNTEHSRI